MKTLILFLFFFFITTLGYSQWQTNANGVWVKRLSPNQKIKKVTIGTEFDLLDQSSQLRVLRQFNSTEQGELLTLSYQRGINYNFDYLFMGYQGSFPYISFNARLNSAWQIDNSSFNAGAVRMIQTFSGLQFDTYKHPNSVNISGQSWVNFSNLSLWQQTLTLRPQGNNVSIGSRSVVYGIHSNYKLSVDGKLVAKEIIVTNGPEWADYVFKSEYKLKDLNEVEKFILENDHLPGLPSAEEIKVHGLNIADIMTKQMVKIEELTLYIIQLKKEIEQLKLE